MPAVPDWAVLLRGGVLRSLSQRGVPERLGGLEFQGMGPPAHHGPCRRGHRRQQLLPYPWESDQLEAIRDGVVKPYEDFQAGIPLEQAIAELSAARAESQASSRCPALGVQPSPV